MTKAIPGPWVIGNEGYNANTVYAGDAGVCQMYGVPMNARVDDVGERYAVGMANARLIAAAPELLEALEALWKQALQSTVNDPANEWGIEALDMARTAIRKAKGEA